MPRTNLVKHIWHGSRPEGSTREKDKAFQNALVMVDLEEGVSLWNKIARLMDGKEGSESRSVPGGWTREQDKALENALAMVDLEDGEAI